VHKGAARHQRVWGAIRTHVFAKGLLQAWREAVLDGARDGQALQVHSSVYTPCLNSTYAPLSLLLLYSRYRSYKVLEP